MRLTWFAEVSISYWSNHTFCLQECRWSVLTFLRITCFLLVLINIRKKVHNYAIIMNIEGAANDCVQIMLDFKVSWACLKSMHYAYSSNLSTWVYSYVSNWLDYGKCHLHPTVVEICRVLRCVLFLYKLKIGATAKLSIGQGFIVGRYYLLKGLFHLMVYTLRTTLRILLFWMIFHSQIIRYYLIRCCSL